MIKITVKMGIIKGKKTKQSPQNKCLESTSLRQPRKEKPHIAVSESIKTA